MNEKTWPLGYRVSPGLRLYAGFDWTNEGYYLTDSTPADGSTTTQRFRYYEKRVKSGVFYTFNRNCSLNLSAGYAFDRTYNQGSALGLTGTDQITVGAGPFLAGGVQLRW